MHAIPLLLLALAVPDTTARHVYDVAVDANLRHFEVRACFADGLPEQLIADHPLAIKATGPFRYTLEGDAVARTATRQLLHFPVPSDDGCVSWQINLDTIAKAERLNIGYRTRASLLLAPGTWLWRPPTLTANRELLVRFHLTVPMQISVPWEQLPDEAPGVVAFRRDHSPLEWPALMAIGDLRMRDIDVGGANLNLAVADGPADIPADRVEDWLQDAGFQWRNCGESFRAKDCSCWSYR